VADGTYHVSTKVTIARRAREEERRKRGRNENLAHPVDYCAGVRGHHWLIDLEMMMIKKDEEHHDGE